MHELQRGKINNKHNVKPLRILDVGCGRGVLLKAFRSLGHEVIGVEREGSPFEGHSDVVCGELIELTGTALTLASFDIIVLWHVLEHIEKPDQTVSQLSRLLKEEGSLFLSVPNMGSIQAAVFRQHWFHLDLPRHLFHFSERSLKFSLSKNDLKVEHINTFSFDQNCYGFLQSTLNSIPILKNNHLFRTLQKPFSLKVLGIFLLYSPFVVLISFTALIELLVSHISKKGASLNLQVVRERHDQ